MCHILWHTQDQKAVEDYQKEEKKAYDCNIMNMMILV
jgi:hypothetical protein